MTEKSIPIWNKLPNMSELFLFHFFFFFGDEIQYFTKGKILLIYMSYKKNIYIRDSRFNEYFDGKLANVFCIYFL